jgi:hypothetical protein
MICTRTRDFIQAFARSKVNEDIVLPRCLDHVSKPFFADSLGDHYLIDTPSVCAKHFEHGRNTVDYRLPRFLCHWLAAPIRQNSMRRIVLRPRCVTPKFFPHKKCWCILENFVNCRKLFAVAVR